jgi:chromosome segregation ATPase
MLTQSEQRQQELGKNLEQAKNSKDKLNSELSTQADLVADLQKRLETFRADQAALEDEYNKSMKRTAQLQAQVQQLKAKTSLSPVKPADFDLLEKPTSEIELPQEETESPNPADIIDWVLKKKSE